MSDLHVVAGKRIGARLVPLPQHGDLAALDAGLDVTPLQRRQFTHTQPRSVEKFEQHLVPGVAFKSEEAVDLSLIQNALG